MPNTLRVPVVLTSYEDWEEWLEIIRTTSRKGRVWEFIDPNVPRNLHRDLEEPIRPSYESVRATLAQNSELSTPDGESAATSQLRPLRLSDLTSDEKEEYRTSIDEFQYQRKAYKDQDDALREIAVKIQETISRTILPYTYNCSTPYEMLVRLKEQLAPTRRNIELDVVEQWYNIPDQLQGMEIEAWLMKWEISYERIIQLGITQIPEEKAVITFINALGLIDQTYSSQQLMLINNDVISYDFMKAVKTYRDYRRMQKHQLKPRGSHGVFAASLQGRTQQDNQANPSDKDNSKPNEQPQKCVCDKKHALAKCWYIVRSKAPPHWVPNEETEKKINERINQNRELKDIVLKLKKEDQDRTKKKTSQGEPPTVFMTTPVFSVSPPPEASGYALYKSVILDSAATIHVGNDRTRFTSFRHASEKDQLLVGNTVLQIEGFGTMEVIVECPGQPNNVRRIQLENAAYISGFHTCIASLIKFIEKDVHWDTKLLQLMWNEEIFCLTPRKFNQWVIEYHPVEEGGHVYSVLTSYDQRPPLKGTKDDWHQRMGHLGYRTLSFLMSKTKGVKLIRGSYDQNCEVCRLTNAKRLISRRPTMRATIPYDKIHIDLIPMNEGLSGETIVLHILCDYVRMNHVYILPDKKQETVLNTIKDFVQYVQTRWSLIVRTIRLDGERALGKQFEAWIADTGISVERSPPYTPEQNGAAESSGKNLIVRARALRTSANLPENMWPECFQTAGYLLNRSPTKSIKWETPYGKLHKYMKVQSGKPVLSHLRKFGCLAYVYVPNRPKLDKINVRAEKGFLVGYESTNIFRIWMPKTNKVIQSRDVVFDETKIYHPSYEQSIVQEKPIELVEFPEIKQQDKEEDKERPKTTTHKPDVRTTEGSYELDRSEASKSAQIQQPTPDLTPSPMSSATKDTHEEVVSEELQLSQDEEDIVREPEILVVPQTTISRAAKDINGDVDSTNIVEGKRRKIPTRKQTYKDSLGRTNTTERFDSVFMSATLMQKPRLHRTDLPDPPQRWHNLKEHPYGQRFREAALKEYNELQKRETFEVVQTPDIPIKQILPLMWVFTYKFDNDGYLIKFKARLVVRGDMQMITDGKETYAATLAMSIVRAVMALTAYFNLDTIQMDAINAFVNSKLDEEIFVRCPKGFEQEGKCLKLLRALYGLRRAPRLWLEEFTQTLEKLNLVRVLDAPCLFVSKNLILIFYVDDISIFSHSSAKKEVNDLVENLRSSYEFRLMGEVTFFLGIRVIRDRKNQKLWLCQDAYVDKIILSYHLDSVVRSSVPMLQEELKAFEGQATPQEIYQYQQKVGSLNYLATISRPDLARTTQKLSESLLNPGPQHQAAADRALAYIVKTRNLALEFGSNGNETIFKCSSDASYGDNIATRTSSQGYLFSLLGGSIDWKSAKQRTVATSTTEAELIALSYAAKQLYWWQRVFDAISLDIDERYTLNCDNLQTVRLMIKESPKIITKLKHIDIHQHWLRQEVENQNLSINWISTSEMPADGFTKILGPQKHQEFVRQLNLVDISSKL